MTTPAPRSAVRPAKPEFVAPKKISESKSDPFEEVPRKETAYKPGKYVEPVEDIYNFASLALMPFAPNTSMVFQEQVEVGTKDDPEQITVAENCARHWDKAAETNPKIRRMLDKFLGGGALMGLAMAHAPIIVSAASELGLINQFSKLFNRSKTAE